MGPLQKSLAKALPSTTPSSPPTTSKANEKNHRKKSTKQHQQPTSTAAAVAATTTTTKMQWHDNVSYRCFESIATPSPIPIAKINQNQSLHAVHRSTSLDSLANSETNHSGSDNSSQSSWCNTDPEADSDCLSNCDSIVDHKESNSGIDLTTQENLYESYCNNSGNEDPPPRAGNREKPIITELVEKKRILSDRLLLCENRDCAYRQFEQHHLIDDCAPNTDNSACAADDAKSKESTPNAPFILNNNNSNKTRRTSVASSGSVSRMETIVEEPIEPKISVKEILARFETLTSLEVWFLIYILMILLCDIFFPFSTDW